MLTIVEAFFYKEPGSERGPCWPHVVPVTQPSWLALVLQPLKNVEARLRSRAMQARATGQTWPADSPLLSPALEVPAQLFFGATVLVSSLFVGTSVKHHRVTAWVCLFFPPGNRIKLTVKDFKRSKYQGKGERGGEMAADEEPPCVIGKSK